jgi:hypothetical protein
MCILPKCPGDSLCTSKTLVPVALHQKMTISSNEYFLRQSLVICPASSLAASPLVVYAPIVGKYGLVRNTELL